MANLGLALQGMRRWAEAETLQREELLLCVEHYGAFHDETLISLGNLSGLLRNQAAWGVGGQATAAIKAREAHRLLLQIETAYTNMHGADDPRALFARLNRIDNTLLIEGDGCPSVERELRYIIRKASLAFDKATRASSLQPRRGPRGTEPPSHKLVGHFDVLTAALELLGDCLETQRRLDETEVVRRDVVSRLEQRPAESTDENERYVSMSCALESLSDVLVLRARRCEAGEERMSLLDESLSIRRKAVAEIVEENGDATVEAHFARGRLAELMLEAGVDLSEARRLLALAEQAYEDHPDDSSCGVILQIEVSLFRLAEAPNVQAWRAVLRGLEAQVVRAQSIYPAGGLHATALWAHETLERIVENGYTGAATSMAAGC